jgi:DNA-binding Lrp family transcriptional regulator
VSYHQWERERPREYGIGLSKYIMNSMEEFGEKMANQKKVDYPEMLREMTAFVLMSVEAKHDMRIVEKLFALEEVKEVHAVHGSVDIIVKIVLIRDLLSSDAEVIGQFVHGKVRQIQGVVSTQTLIPSYSEVKRPSTAG